MSRTLRATPSKRRPDGQHTEPWVPEAEPVATVTDTQPLAIPVATEPEAAFVAPPRASSPSVTPEQRALAAAQLARGRMLFWASAFVVVAIVLGIVFWALTSG